MGRFPRRIGQLPPRDTMTSDDLVRFLTREARGDVWETRRARLLDLQDLKRPGVVVHARRVAENARLLAFEIGMSPVDADAIYEAGVLHDAGKLAVSEAVLDKNGALDDAERREIKMHAAYGYGLL